MPPLHFVLKKPNRKINRERAEIVTNAFHNALQDKNQDGKKAV
jgi:hypothetical protein